MISIIKQFFDKYVKPSEEITDAVSDHSLQLATAALLVEMMHADAKVNEDEQKTIIKSIRSKFHLTEEETHAVIELAHEKQSNSTDFYTFTSLINKGFTYEQKVKVVEHMWEVAFADAELDKHEEHTVRKIANLLFVKHRDFIDTKLRVKKEKLSK
jgi:uncharacterized tellurite resistance protein B-like protein